MNELYFEWDEVKRKTNIKKHDVDFADVTDLFYDEETIIIRDPEHYDEERYIALGMDTKSGLFQHEKETPRNVSNLEVNYER